MEDYKANKEPVRLGINGESSIYRRSLQPLMVTAQTGSKRVASLGVVSFSTGYAGGGTHTLAKSCLSRIPPTGFPTPTWTKRSNTKERKSRRATFCWFAAAWLSGIIQLPTMTERSICRITTTNSWAWRQGKQTKNGSGTTTSALLRATLLDSRVSTMINGVGE